MDTNRVRGFEPVVGAPEDMKMPERSTTNSAGYDFFAAETVTVRPVSYAPSMRPTLVKTNIKAYMQPDEFLQLCNRSSNPKKGLLMANGVGIVDSDYYSNPDNDGNIGFIFWNVGDEALVINKGDKIGQGIFLKYLKTDDDSATGERSGGWGSTGA